MLHSDMYSVSRWMFSFLNIHLLIFWFLLFHFSCHKMNIDQMWYYPSHDATCRTVLLSQWLVYRIQSVSRNTIQCWKACNGEWCTAIQQSYREWIPHTLQHETNTDVYLHLPECLPGARHVPCSVYRTVFLIEKTKKNKLYTNSWC